MERNFSNMIRRNEHIVQLMVKKYWECSFSLLGINHSPKWWKRGKYDS